MLDPSLANPPPFTVVPGKRLQAALKLHPHTFQTARAWSREGSVHVSRLKVICKLPHMGFRQLPCHTAWSMCPLCIRDASKRDGSSKMDHGGHSPPSRCSLCLVRNTVTMELAWLHSWEAICEVLRFSYQKQPGFHHPGHQRQTDLR